MTPAQSTGFLGHMSFETQITRVPHPHNMERGADALAALDLTKGARADLVRGAAGSSPYLAELIAKEAAWVKVALQLSPDAAWSALQETAPEGDLKVWLRQQKRRVALLTALADLGGAWDLQKVTDALSVFAARAVDLALKDAVAREIGRRKLPGQAESDIESAGGLAVLAMGKMGAFELNYSSDIDLICLYDETRFEVDDYGEARASFVRAVRWMAQALSERTADGYVFRTDLRLRPDASVTPVAISMEAAERYYESFGRTWERAAFIKARAAAGDVAAGERFLKALGPFVWRRNLDYAAVQDAHDMRLRIRDHKGLHHAPSHLGHDLKLGQGGIREIEFFTQTRQLIAGGRDKGLRDPRTVEGLRALAAKDWIKSEDAETLIADYRALREAEHRVQMIADQQTHVLPSTEQDFARLAALAGENPGDYKDALIDRFHRVHRLTEGFFAPDARPAEDARAVFSSEASAITDRWPGYPALRSRRAVEIFKRVRPMLMERLAKAARPDEALVHFDGFLSGLPAGVQVFSLFEANPQLLDLVVDIVDTAPGLGRHLSRNAGVFDAVIGGEFFSDWPGVDGLTKRLSGALEELGDYEARLDLARVLAREWHFRIGVHHLRGLTDAQTAGAQYAELAQASVAALWPYVVDAFAAKHGLPPGRGATILGMGSLGARRLSAASDLDLIVIYDGAGEDSSEGQRPLATRAYYARLTQALVTAISAPTAEGRLYEVDMRLRPSGRQGPVATGFEAFKAYQSNEAWTWEHLALTRARSIAGSRELGADVDAFRAELLAKARDRKSVLKDVGEMRTRLAAAHSGDGADLDVKLGPGRMQDLELLLQAGTLLAGDASTGVSDQIGAAANGLALSEEEVEVVREAATLYWQVQAAVRLIGAGGALEDDLGAGALAFLTRETGARDVAALQALIAGHAAKVTEIIDKIARMPD